MTYELTGDVRNIEKRKKLPFEPTPAEEAIGITRFKKMIASFNGKYNISEFNLPDEFFKFTIDDIIKNKVVMQEVESPSYSHLHNIIRYERIVKGAAILKQDENAYQVTDRLERLRRGFQTLHNARLLTVSQFEMLTKMIKGYYQDYS
jgi:hypothetical protein